MLEIIGCKNCGNASIPLGSVTVNVTLKMHKWCDHCGQSKTSDQQTFFCSTECFHAYMLKVVNGEVELKWKELKVVDGVVKYV